MKKIVISVLGTFLLLTSAAYAQTVDQVFLGLDEFVSRLSKEDTALFAGGSAATQQSGTASGAGSANSSAGAGLTHSGAEIQILQSSTEAQKQIALLVMAQLGKKYQYGAAGPEQFDCSGLVYYVFSQAGKQVPRTSQKQGEAGVLVDKSKLQVGDLVFFDTRSTTNPSDITIDEEDTLSLFAGEGTSAAAFSPSKVTHSGIYIGDGKFIHASSGSVMKVVVEELESKYFAQRFLFAKSYLAGEI